MHVGLMQHSLRMVIPVLLRLETFQMQNNFESQEKKLALMERHFESKCDCHCSITPVHLDCQLPVELDARTLAMIHDLKLVRMQHQSMSTRLFLNRSQWNVAKRNSPGTRDEGATGGLKISPRLFVLCCSRLFVLSSTKPVVQESNDFADLGMYTWVWKSSPKTKTRILRL